ncbi:hypothetical protein EMCRGX_G016900 [Ephydatia muelleri]
MKCDVHVHRSQSLDYEMYNYPYQQIIRGYHKWTYLHITFMRWLLVGMIGCVTGLVAFAVNYGIEKLLQLKHEQLDSVYFPLSGGSAMYGLLVLLGFNSLFVLISAGLVVLPVASGSGVTKIKCYLNGVKIPHVVRISALFVKMFGVILSVSAASKSGAWCEETVHSISLLPLRQREKGLCFLWCCSWFSSFQWSSQYCSLWMCGSSLLRNMKDKGLVLEERHVHVSE